jgi:hypothetical protein
MVLKRGCSLGLQDSLSENARHVTFIGNTPQIYVCKIHASLSKVEITSLAHIKTNFRSCSSANHDK